MTAESSRLAVFLPSLVGGGAERITINLIRELSGRGLDIDLVVGQANGPFLDDVPEAVRLIDLNGSRLVTSLPALVRYLRRERPTTMLTAMSHTNVIGLWARALARVPTRVIVAEHDTLSVVTKETVRRRARLMPRLIARTYPRADAIIAVSTGVADDLAAATGLDRSKIAVVYNPVITPEVVAASRAEVHHAWFGPGEPPVVLGIGRLAPKKDFPLLVRAFAQVRETSNARLVILGEGPERAEIEELVRSLGLEADVDLPGFVDNPYAHLAKASVFVLSSRWEGLPTVLIEAMFCGTPVVATDCPSGPREILDGGRHGSLVPSGDVDALADAIRQALAGSVEPAPRHSWEPFELAAVADRYADLAFGNDSSSRR